MSEIIGTNGAPVVYDPIIDTNYVESTNPIPYAYNASLVLGPDDPPVLQWVDSQHILCNCWSNQACYLYYTGTLPAAIWFGLAPVTNGTIITVPTEALQVQQLYFRLQVIPNRFYVQILPGPDGSYPTNAYMEPQWSLQMGYWRPLEDMTNALFPMWGNTYVGLQYDSSVFSATDWPCAVVIEAWPDGNGGVAFSTNQFYMGISNNIQFFDVSYYRRTAGSSGAVSHAMPIVDGCGNPDSPTNYVVGNTNLQAMQGTFYPGGTNPPSDTDTTNISPMFYCLLNAMTNQEPGFGTNANDPYHPPLSLGGFPLRLSPVDLGPIPILPTDPMPHPSPFAKPANWSTDTEYPNQTSPNKILAPALPSLEASGVGILDSPIPKFLQSNPK